MSHHGHAIFSLPNATKTTITDESNWNYDDDIDAKGDDAKDKAQPQVGAIMGDAQGGDGSISGDAEVRSSGL